MIRKTILSLFSLCFLSSLLIASVQAQSIVGRVTGTTVEYKLFLNNPVGSGADRAVRKLSQLVKEQSNIDLVVVNQGGAGGLLVAKEFKNEKLAVVVVNTSILIYGPLAGNNELTKTYSLSDFDIVADLGLAGSVWFTHPDSGIKTPEDLITILPNLPKSSIGVASQDSMANARALVKKNNFSTPIITFKNHNETVVQVAGKHVSVGVAIMNTESIYALAKNKELVILGYSGSELFSFRGFSLSPIARHLDLPPFYGGSWLAITPGKSNEHSRLKSSLLMAMQNQDLQNLIKEAWPLGDSVPFQKVYDTAVKHKDLFK